MRVIYNDSQYTIFAGDIGEKREIIELEPVEVPATTPAEPVPA